MSLLWVYTSPKNISESKSITYGKMVTDLLISGSSDTILITRQTFSIPHLNIKNVYDNEPLINEVLNCDKIVLSFPMWNGHIPSSLKAWIDNVVISGKSFHYDPEQKKIIGHGKAKKVYIVVTCGTSVEENSERDFITPYLKNIMNMLFIDCDIKVLWVNNVYDSTVNERVNKKLEFFI